jgi:hypothetical protein
MRISPDGDTLWSTTASGSSVVPAQGTAVHLLWGGNVITMDTVFPPIFTSHPADHQVIPGTELRLEAYAEGEPPIFYQWWHEGRPLPEARQPELVLDFSHPKLIGEYVLEASNQHGSIFSRPARVTVETRMLLSPKLAGNGTVLEVLLNAPEGLRYRVEGSSDGESWMPVLETDHYQNPSIISIPLQPEWDRQYFRVHSAPGLE